MSITKIQKQLEAPPNHPGHPGHVDIFYAERGRVQSIWKAMKEVDMAGVAGVVRMCFKLFLYFCYGHVVMLYLFRFYVSPISFSFCVCVWIDNL